MARATPHDLFEIQMLFNEICELLKEAGIDLKAVGRCRLFLNADLVPHPASKTGYNAYL